MKSNKMLGKRILAHMLTIVMLLTNVPVNVLAANNPEANTAGDIITKYSDSIQMPGLETLDEEASSPAEESSEDETQEEGNESGETDLDAPEDAVEGETEPSEDENNTEGETAPSEDEKNTEEDEKSAEEAETNEPDVEDETAQQAEEGAGEDLSGKETAKKEDLRESDNLKLLGAGEEGDVEGKDEEENTEAETWTVTFYNRDAEVYNTVEVEKGKSIGDQLPTVIAREDYIAYWAIGEILDGSQGNTINVIGPRIDETFTPTKDTTVVPDYDKVTYEVTFYSDEDKNDEVSKKTVDVDSNYCVNDIPDVPAKDGYTGKWVYSDGDFGNTVTITVDTDVWAEYEQNVFAVIYKTGEDTYQTDTYYYGNTLVLPADPVVEGKTFAGWYVGDTKYVGGESVTSDLTIEARFDDSYAVRFIVVNDTGVSERLSQYFRSGGEIIGTLPQDPFISGKVFEKWVVATVNEDGTLAPTETEVTAETPVIGDMTVVAVFRTLKIYDITAEYYYLNKNDEKVIFNTDLHQVEENNFPYTIEAPASTQTDENEVPGAPIYYPENPIIEVNLTDFDENKKVTVRFEYVLYTAVYDYVYYLKDLEGGGYTEIDRTPDVQGVLNSYVTPTVKTYDYAVLERAEGAVIETSGLDGQDKQELKVYYTRKNYQVTYETNGGSYVAGATVPYGTRYRFTTENPTRTGYTFAGWYTDENLTQPAGSTVEVHADATLYAKWNGDTVGYTIIYMKEVYDIATGTTSYVYEGGRDANGTVGTTVYAASAPNAPNTSGTLNGYERSNDTSYEGSSVDIAADGSSVLVVRYDLIRYTYVFNTNEGTINIGGQTYSGSSYTINDVVIGMRIAPLWPASSDEIYRNNRYFTGWNDGHSWSQITDLETVTYEYVERANNSNIVTWTARWSQDGNSRDAQYWLQQPDGTWAVTDEYTQKGLNTTKLGPKNIDGYTQHNGDASRPNNSYPASGNTNVEVEVWVDEYDNTLTWNGGSNDYNVGDTFTIYGHTYTVTSKERRSGYQSNPYSYTAVCHEEGYYETQTVWRYVYNFYYDRAQYDILYNYNGSQINKIEDIFFEADISGPTFNYTPSKPANTSEIDYSDYNWGGWYADSALQTPYTFGTMPGHDLPLYAKWVAPKYTVSFDLDGGSPDVESQMVEKYKKATAPATNPTKEGYTFEGWYADENRTTLFDWNTQITEDTTVYGKWSRDTLSYTVRYVDMEDNTVAPDKTVPVPDFEIGQTVTESVIAIAGYRPDRSSASIELSGTNSENVIFFTYSQKVSTTSYIVNYVIANGESGAGTVVATQKHVENVKGDTSSVVELAAPVDYSMLYGTHPEFDGIEFYPDQVEKTFVLTANENQNIFTFYYSAYKNAKVTIHYVDMDNNPIASDHTEVLKVGKTFTLSRTPISGWELYSAVKGNGTSGEAAGTDYKITQAIAKIGTLEFTLVYKKKVTITAKSLSKQYDGTALMLTTAIGGPVTVTGLPDGESLTDVSFKYTNTDNDTSDGRINAGVVTVTPENAKTDGNHVAKNYYAFHYISGTLTVNKINVTVRIEPDRWTGIVYDGIEKEAGFTNPDKNVKDYILIIHEGYAATYRNTIWETIKTKIQHGGDGLGYYGLAKTDAGDYNYSIPFTLADLPTDNNYSVSLYVREGRLHILPKEVIVTTGSDEKSYDGTALTNNEARITGLVEVDENKVTVTATGSQTEVGESDNTYSIEWGDAKSSNYKISDDLGKLKVNKAPISIVVKEKEVPYNGDLQEGYDITLVTGTGAPIVTEEYMVTGLPEGFKLNIEYTPAEGTYVGTYDNSEFVDVTVTYGNKDVTGSFVITTTKGNLVITDENVDSDLILTKNDEKADSYKYEEGETVTFNITVTNIYNKTVNIELSEIEGVTLEQSAFDNVEAGRTVNTTATYTIKPADMANGSFTNTVTATLEGRNYTAQDTVYTIKIDAKLTVEKTANPTSGVKVGDTVAYTVVVTNSGNVTVKDITMSDTLVTLSEEIFTLAPEGTKTITYNYTVTQTDVDAGKINNTATATGKNPKDAIVTASDGAEVTTVVIVDPTTIGSEFGIKNLTATTADGNGHTFNFTLSPVTEDAPMPEADGAQASVSYAAAETGIKTIPFGKITYKKAGTYKYTITETPVGVGWTTMGSGEIVTVTIGDNEGILSAAVDTITIENSYAVEEIEVDPTDAETTFGKKNLEATTQDGKGHTFTFTLSAVTEGAPMPEGSGAEASVSYAAAETGEKVLPFGEITYTAAGEYEYRISEDAASYTSGNGWTIVNNDAVVKVIITDNGDGTLSAEVDATEIIKNGYKLEKIDVDPTATATTFGKKELSATTADGEGHTFSFTLSAVTEGAPMPAEGGNTASVEYAAGATGEKAIPFGSIEYTKAGEYEYKISEEVGSYTSENGWTITNNDAVVKVTITDNGNGTFSSAIDGTKVIENSYAVEEIEVDPTEAETTFGRKNVTTGAEGGADKEFSFKLEAVTEGAPMPASATASVTYAANEEGEKAIPFGSIIYTAAGEYQYTVTEATTGEDDGWTYDNGPKTITVKVTDNGDGTLSAAVDDTAEIENSYKANDIMVDMDTEGSIFVKKTVTGTGFLAKRFSFSMIEVDENGEVLNGTNAITKTSEEFTEAGTKAIDYGTITYSEVGTHYYNVTETTTAVEGDGWTLDSMATTGKIVIVEITDNGKGGLEAAVNGVTFTNRYSSEPELTVTTSADPAEGVGEGDTVTYTVVVKNSGNVTVTGITLADVLMAEEDEPNAFSLTPGDEKKITYGYEVTQADVYAGEIINTATATGRNPSGEEVTKSGTATVTTMKAETALVITADSDQKSYDGTPLIKDSYTVSGLADGDSIASVVITGSQTLVGSSLNVPSEAVIVNADGEDVTANYDITYVNGTLTVTGPEYEAEKTTPTVITPYALGDEIPFTITVTNISDTDMAGVNITDADATIVAGTGYTVVDEHNATAFIPAGASVVVNATHTVTSRDILAGSVMNTATVSYGDTTQTVTSTTDQIDDIDGTMSVQKTVASTQATYNVGDVITYQINVINMGNVPFINIVVNDELTGLSETIDVLNPLESRTFETSYTVTSEDILKGSVTNVATSKADDIPDPKDPENPVVPQDDDTVTVETDDLDTSMTVEKIVTNGAGNRVFGLGETIEYQILVTNTGNVDYTNVVVIDELTGLTETIALLGRGETRTFNTSYTVTSDDILKGSVVNVVTAEGDDIPDPKMQDPETPSSEDDVEVPTTDVNATLTVDKNVTSGSFYRAGDVITYEIVVTNTGNVPYANVVVTDNLTGLRSVIPTLGVGQSRTFTTSYTVTEADITRGYVENEADAVGEELPDDRHTIPLGEDSVVTPVAQQVTLRINYRYEDGTQAMDPFNRTYTYGNNYSVTSPTIEGYTVNITTVAGTITSDTVVDVTYTRNAYTLTVNYVNTATGAVMYAPYTAVVPYGDTYTVASPAFTGYTRTQAAVTGTMPGHDVQITVFYTPIPTPRPNVPAQVGDTIIEDYDTPLGLGAVGLNAGDSIE